MKNLKYLVFGIIAAFVVTANVDAAVCTGDACEAQIGDVKHDTLANAIIAAEDGDTVELLKSIETTYKIVIEKDGAITIDGNGFIVTTTAQKAFEVWAVDDADADDDKTLKITFKDIQIVNNYLSTSSKGARAIDTRTDYIELIIDGGTISTPNTGNVHDQPITIGGSTVNPKVVKVSIKDTKITGGKTSYAFITYLPVDLDIVNSEITGWAALYFNKDRWNGDTPTYSSEGSVVNIEDSKLTGISDVADNGSNDFGTIVSDVADITINVNNSTITATGKNGAYQSAFSADEELTGEKINVTISGEKSEVTVNNKEQTTESLLTNDSKFNVTINSGTFNTDVKEYLAAGTKLDETTGKVLTEYKVTVGKVENGTVKVDKIVAYEGDEVKVTVTANKGYKVKSVTVNGEEVKDNKFTMPNKDVEVKVEFELEKVEVKEEPKKETSKVETPKTEETKTDSKPVTNVETNPKTGDAILLYSLIGIIAITGLGITLKHKRAN